jgi:glycosyltransferase involved in cell wall biosynthesis
MDSNPKILVLAQTNIISGAETVMGEYMTNNRDVEILVYTNRLSSVRRYFEDLLGSASVLSADSMRSYLVKKNPLLFPFYLWNLVVNVWRAISIANNNSINVIYGNNSTDLGTLCFIKLLKGQKIRVIAHCHDMLTMKTLPGMYLKILSRLLDVILVPSQATKSRLESLCHRNCDIRVVYNGLSSKTAMGDKGGGSCALVQTDFQETKKVIGFVGTICRRKRPDIFLDIIRELLLIRNDIAGIMIGKVIEDDVGTEVEKRIQEEALPVRFLGEVPHDELLSLYQRFDLLVLTSDRDPLPTVLIEAMFQGCVVFARDVDGVSEIIVDGESGYVFDYEYNLQEVVSRICCIIDSNELRSYVSERAKEVAANRFCIERKINEVNQIIREVGGKEDKCGGRLVVGENASQIIKKSRSLF